MTNIKCILSFYKQIYLIFYVWRQNMQLILLHEGFKFTLNLNAFLKC